MLGRGSGSIVNVSTMAAGVCMPGLSVYAATKAALESLTRTWAAEFSPSGVRVNTMSPGPTGTEMSSTAMDEETIAQIAAPPCSAGRPSHGKSPKSSPFSPPAAPAS